MHPPIYMDYQATTPLDPRVLDAMLPYLQGRFGNASSGTHRFGWEAAAAVKAARAQCALAIGADPLEIVFTSGSTEAINLALKGVVEASAAKPGHIVTCVTEHAAVLDVAAWLEARGTQVTRLPVDGRGSIDLGELARAIRGDTRLVALMAANNEIGTLHPLAAIGQLCHERGVLFFTDATQGVGKVPIDVRGDGIDLLAFSGHKLYGPKGVGFLYVRNRDPHVELVKQVHGGGQERDMRSGTLNVPGIVGLGKACELALAEMGAEGARLTGLRERLYRGIVDQLDRVYRNGNPAAGLPGNLNLSFEYVDGEALIMDLADFALSSGSACSSTSMEPSHVLTAIGRSPALAHASLRFGLGRMTTAAEVELAIERTVAAVRRLRDLSPMYELARDAGLTADVARHES